MEINSQEEQIIFQSNFPITEECYLYVNMIGMLTFSREFYIFIRYFILLLILYMLPLAFIRTVSISISLAIGIVIISLLSIILTKIQMRLDPKGKHSVLDSYRHACNVTRNMELQAKKNNRTIFYTYKIFFYDNSLQIETLDEKQQINYSLIEHLIELKKYIFLCSCYRQAYIIDKSSFSEEELIELKDFLELKCHKKLTDMCFLDISKIKGKSKGITKAIVIILVINWFVILAILLMKYTP